jgi:hypothetical protein
VLSNHDVVRHGTRYGYPPLDGRMLGIGRRSHQWL